MLSTSQARDDRLDGQAREQRDLLADLLRERALGAAHEHVRRDADAPQLVDGVLGRLGLQLARVADVGDEREVDEHAAPAPTSTGNWRIASRNGSDSMSPTVPPISVITKSTSRGLGDQRDPLLDLVGDVRHDLHGAAEVVAAALAADDGVVDAAGGDVRGAAGVGVGEALVVAEVEVGLRAVLGDEHLAVLVGRHRAGVDVDVGVELLQADRQAARDEQPPDRGGGDALAERGDDAAGHEDEPGLARAPVRGGRSGAGSCGPAPRV